MLPVSYAVPGAGTSPKFAEAFARGCGGGVTTGTTLKPGPVAMFGSPKRWDLLLQAQAEGRDWYYCDHAYFGRGQYYRVTKNRYQHTGTGDADPGRFAAFGRPVQPWRSKGRHVLLCPNSDTYFRLYGLEVQQWILWVTRTLREHTDREIRVRWKKDAKPIAEDLREAWAVVVFSSVAALDALIAGVPVFTLAQFAASVRMGLSDLSRIESPIYPDGRQQFLEVLASNQWTMAEIANGTAWRVLAEANYAAA